MRHKGNASALRMFASVSALVICAILLLAAARGAGTPTILTAASQQDPRLSGAYRFEQGGWIYVHLQGAPERIGYAHGYLLAPEIADALAAVKLTSQHETQRDWEFFRKAAREMLWPKIDPEYQAELKGIAEGLRARNVPMDLDDVVALNAFEELPDYYVPWYDKQHKVASAPHITSPGSCSAFVATGSWTRDHQVVIAHNNWTSYLHGERWRVILDIVPEQGNRILMDGFPGVIISDDDFGVNSAGIAVTETTITQFSGWDPNGIPEFARARKAMQYANSIDDFARIMTEGNNGGYANDWLVVDRKAGEVARLELGLKNSRLWRTKDGYFVGSNFPLDPKVLTEETTFNPKDPASSPNARRARWEQLMQENKGRLDASRAEKLISDHYDSYLKKEVADQRTLCGHVDASAEGTPEWEWGPHYPGGAVQGKAADASMLAAMSFAARAGHPCGADFLAKPFLAAHPAFAWQQPLLRDMKAGPWTTFRSEQKAAQ